MIKLDLKQAKKPKIVKIKHPKPTKCTVKVATDVKDEDKRW